MGRLVQLFRLRYDYSVFQIRDEWPFLLSVAGVILGAATILPTSVGIVLGVIAFLLGLGVFVRDVRELRRRWKDYEFNRFAAPFPTADIRPPSAYPDPEYLFVPGDRRGTALVSDAIDHAIATQDMAVRLEEEPYHLPKTLRISAHYVLPKVNKGRAVFNGKIIGMHGDPLPHGSNARPGIRLHIAQFFDAQCSNEMCAFKITHVNGDPAFDPRRELLRNANGELRTLAESDLADCIGVSTIAFTADNALVLTSQTDSNIASGGLLAPSGSGSLDLRDLGPREEILQDVVRRGMERELCEETGIRQREIRKTEVIGFARWMDRGAKPEFFGITNLSITAAEIAAGRHVSRAERMYTDRTSTTKVDLAELGRELSSGVDLLSTASLPEAVRDFGSLPLLLALRVAALRSVSVGPVAQEQPAAEPRLHTWPTGRQRAARLPVVRSPLSVGGFDHAAQPAGIALGQVVSDDLQDFPGLVHVRTAFPDTAAVITVIPQPVIRAAHEPAPELQRLLSLPRHQACVLKLGDDTPAVGRQAGKLRDTLRPEGAFADRQPRLPAGTNLNRPPTRHCPFESGTCTASSYRQAAPRDQHPWD